MNKDDSVYKTALLLVEHFDYCIQRDGKGIHSRVFSHILHPEEYFVAVGSSREVTEGAAPHPEHIVPCSTLISESFRLLKERIPKSEIAALLAKHWKIVYISKEQARILDTKKGGGLNLQYKMPPGWNFETGDSYARLNLAKIEVLPIEG